MRFIIFPIVALLIAFAIAFGPFLCRLFAYKKAEKIEKQSIDNLPVLYEKCLVLVTERLGEGESRNSDIEFEQTHKNQQFAVNSVLYLLSEMGE